MAMDGCIDAWDERVQGCTSCEQRAYASLPGNWVGLCSAGPVHERRDLFVMAHSTALGHPGDLDRLAMAARKMTSNKSK